jgi:hypothetical protein
LDAFVHGVFSRFGEPLRLIPRAIYAVPDEQSNTRKYGKARGVFAQCVDSRATKATFFNPLHFTAAPSSIAASITVSGAQKKPRVGGVCFAEKNQLTGLFAAAHAKA